jgi:hypothetical protein
MAVHMCRAGQGELDELGVGARDDAGKVHHLGEADHAPPAKEALEVAGKEPPARRLELRGRHAGRGHEEHVQREIRAEIREPVDTVGPQNVRDLVRIRHHRGRPEREHESRELVHEELRGLQVHVRVDEARDEVAAGELENLGSVVVAEARDEAVRDREVAVEPLAREGREDPGAPDDQVGGLVSAGNCEAALEVRHYGENVLVDATANVLVCLGGCKPPHRRVLSRPHTFSVCGLPASLRCGGFRAPRQEDIHGRAH